MTPMTYDSQQTDQAIESPEVPRCEVFGRCGGCLYQDRSYEDELSVKRRYLQALCDEAFPEMGFSVEEVIPSPKIYDYRHRLDLTMKRTRIGILMGFQAPDSKKMIEIESCPIAMKEVSDFLPQLKREAIDKLPDKYRTANLVVRAGADRRVAWGGIGRRSLRMAPEDYLWAEVKGKKICFSLETFFQANLSILDKVMEKIESLNVLDARTHFYDLYSGVGLFGLVFSNIVDKVFFVEDVPSSVSVLRHNIQSLNIKNAEVHQAKVEDVIEHMIGDVRTGDARHVAMIDPPRRGLHETAAQALAGSECFNEILYLSCGPEALMRDLKVFMNQGWKVGAICPFDFFPRTKHIETLVTLKRI